MKIVAPANSVEDVIEYNRLEVSEIYLGLNEIPSKEKEGKKWDTVNERFEEKASFSTLESLKQASKINKKASKPAELSLVLNKSFYNESQFERAKEQIVQLKDYIDNFIISDLSLLGFIKKNAPSKGIILSCLSVCQNSDSVKFYKGLGIRRIILPRHLTLEEIESITRNNLDMEFEVMILNQFCRNIDGFCCRCHIPFPEEERFRTICNLPVIGQLHFIKEGKENKKSLIEKNLCGVIKNFNPFCGICFLKRLKSAGVDYLKIVGRTNTIQRKISDVRFISNAIGKMNLSDQEFAKYCKDSFNQYYKFKCEKNCYY